MNRYSFKKDMTNQHMKRCLMASFQGNANQTTTRYHFISTGMVITKKIDNNGCW